MAIRLGLNAKLYRNTGSYASPTWDEIGNVKDVTLNLESAEADVTVRANNGWRATVPTLKEASVEFEMVWDTEDDDFTAIRRFGILGGRAYRQFHGSNGARRVSAFVRPGTAGAPTPRASSAESDTGPAAGACRTCCPRCSSAHLAWPAARTRD